MPLKVLRICNVWKKRGKCIMYSVLHGYVILLDNLSSDWYFTWRSPSRGESVRNSPAHVQLVDMLSSFMPRHFRHWNGLPFEFDMIADGLRTNTLPFFSIESRYAWNNEQFARWREHAKGVAYHAACYRRVHASCSLFCLWHHDAELDGCRSSNTLFYYRERHNRIAHHH